MRTKAKPMKSTVGIQVINMTCQCGGSCVNHAGSTMIEETDIYAECLICGHTYNVPTKVFVRKEIIHARTS
jgi:hypothetical protein